MILVERLPAVPPAPDSRPDSLALTWEERAKTRQQVRSAGGRDIGIKLPTGTRLVPGTVVHVGDGFHVRVVAAPEEVWLIRSDDTERLLQVAYELGNRHFPIEIAAGTLATRYDHTLAELWERLGITAERVQRPFLCHQRPAHRHA